MPPGHVAVTWGVAATLQRTHPARLDYRLLALCALAPDLIDKPLALLVFTGAQTSQLIAHSLFLNLGLLCLALLVWRRVLPYGLAFNLHLVADRMWHHTESFWWPLYGWNVFWTFKPMNTPETMISVYFDIVTRYPQVWVIELVAIVYLLWFTGYYRFYRWPVLKRFLLSGQVESLLSHSSSARPVPAPFRAAGPAADRGDV